MYFAEFLPFGHRHESKVQQSFLVAKDSFDSVKPVVYRVDGK